MGNTWAKPGEMDPYGRQEERAEMVPLLCWKLTAADAGRIATSAAATEMQSSAALMPHLQMKALCYCAL